MRTVPPTQITTASPCAPRFETPRLDALHAEPARVPAARFASPRRSSPQRAVFAALLCVASAGCSDSKDEPAEETDRIDAPTSTAASAPQLTSASARASTPQAPTSSQASSGAPSGSGAASTSSNTSPSNSSSASSGATQPPDGAGGSGGADSGGGGAPASGGAGAAGSGGTPAGGPNNSGGDGPGAGGAAGSSSTPADGGSSSDEDPFGPDIDGECTESQRANSNASGSGPYEVVVETNSDSGINEGTIFRPANLAGDELFPIFVWGEGGCSQNGLSNATAMAEIASHGYFVVADGTPNGGAGREMDSNNVVGMGEPLLAYVDWAIAENAKPCSAYYHRLNSTKVAANGFSCGGLMATGTAGDPRITTWGSTSSGTFSANQALYESVHTPVLIIEGGPSDIAYENGARDYDNISALGHPIMWFSKDIGHGGDLNASRGGDFTRINLAWLNWWLKGDESETGKGVLVGGGCTYCSDAEWEVKSANLP